MSAELSVTLFFLTIVAGLFILPIKVRLAQNEILNEVASRCCWVLALMLLSLTSAVVATIANHAALGVNSEIFRILWFTNWTSLFFIGYIMVSFMFKMLSLWTISKHDKRMGNE